MTAPVILITRAFAFAARRHVDQRRKGERAEPYVNHLAEVAELVAEASGGEDPVLVAAAILHDVVEDTPTSLEEVARRFGPQVAELVAEVTDDTALPSAERKRRQLARAPELSSRARRIKIADKISNLRALRTSPPRGWDEARKAAYLSWSRAVVDALRGTDPRLERAFDEEAKALAQALGCDPAP